MRWLSQAPYSGSEIGECYAIAHLINDGDNESWLVAAVALLISSLRRPKTEPGT
jgi:hypothetical protein